MDDRLNYFLSYTFYFTLYFTDLAERGARIINKSVNLSTIPPKCYEFTNIFSKAKAETLAPHHLYDLQIKLKNRKKSFVGTIYLILAAKQEVLKKFISRNLSIRFIYSTFFSLRLFILFVKEKDSPLCLYVNFQGLNHII